MGASAVSTDDSGASVTTADIYPEADLQRLQSAVRVLLSGLGEDISREGLQDTPKVPSRRSIELLVASRSTCQTRESLCALQRVAKAWVDVSSGYRQDLHRLEACFLSAETLISVLEQFTLFTLHGLEVLYICAVCLEVQFSMSQ